MYSGPASILKGQGFLVLYPFKINQQCTPTHTSKDVDSNVYANT